MLHQDPTPAFEPETLETPLPVGYGVIFSSSMSDDEEEEEDETVYLVYVVESGDTLSGIADAELGDASRWQEIFELNKDSIKNPDMIKVGQELYMPEDWDAEAE